MDTTTKPKQSVEAFARQNCVSILLARQRLAAAQSPPPTPKPKPHRRKPYTCKACNITFHTSQALGGHRASHARYKFNLRSLSGTRPYKAHDCAECRMSFETGQALGGHMRGHVDLARKRRRGEETEEEEEMKSETAPFPDGSNVKRALLIDLNFPPVADE